MEYNDDSVLEFLNETELLELARGAGVGLLKRGLDRKELIGIVSGAIRVTQAHKSTSEWTRGKLEGFIQRHWGVVMSQLPGCNGACRTYKCSEGRHAMCFGSNAEMIDK